MNEDHPIVLRPGAFPAVYVFRVKGAVDNRAENDYYISIMLSKCQ